MKIVNQSIIGGITNSEKKKKVNKETKSKKLLKRSKVQNDLRAKLRKSGKVADVAALLLARQG